MKGQNVAEYLAGALVLAVAALFLFYAYTTAGAGRVDGYPLQARFDSIDGLTTGSDVRISGIKVGVVLEERLDSQDYAANVVFSVDENVRLPVDSSAKIAVNGLFGGAYLSIQPGGAEEMLQANDSIDYTQGSVDLISLIGQAVFSTSGNGADATP